MLLHILVGTGLTAARTMPEGRPGPAPNPVPVRGRSATSAPTADPSVAVVDALAASGLDVAAAPAEEVSPGIVETPSITVDSVRRFESKAHERAVWRRYDLREGDYVLVVLRRHSGESNPGQLTRMASALANLADQAPVILLVHAGTRARLAASGGLEALVEAGVQCVSPLRYLDLLSLKTGAGAVLTDSGRAVEEAAALGVPCFTLDGDVTAPAEVSVKALIDHPRRRAAEIPRDVVDVLGVGIDNLDMAQTVAQCERLIKAGGYAQHVCINVAKLMTLRNDPELRQIIDDCSLVSADGQPIVWASRLLGTPLPARVAGIDLMHELLKLSAEKGLRPFIIGARGEVLDEAVQRMQERYPGLELAGWRDGYFAPDEEDQVCAEIRATRPDILFVAMGSPKKEYVLSRYGRALGVPFVMGVGGAIDVAAGRTRRAPVAWQRLGFEWLYRLLQEPRRLGRRYLTTNAAFFSLVLREIVRHPRRRRRDHARRPLAGAVSPSSSR